LNVRPNGAFVHSDVMPVLLQTSVDAPVVAGPLTGAFPVHRPCPLSVGAVTVKVPLNSDFVTVPVMVPLQSNVVETQVPEMDAPL
jgi:hypothetical protein